MHLKKIIISSILLLGNIWCFSQSDSLDDFWKDIDRRKGMKKNDLTEKYDSIIMKTFENKVYIVRQDYVYENNNKRYVKEADDYYSQIYGIGVATRAGILTSKHLFEPWKNDHSLLIEKGFTPIRTEVEMKIVSDTFFTRKDEGKYEIMVQDSFALYPFKKEDTNSDHIQPDSIGLLVLFYHNSHKDSIWRTIISFNPKWSHGVAEIDTQLNSNQLIGGLFVNADTLHDKGAFNITGMLSADYNHHFKLIAFNDFGNIKSLEKTTEESKKKGSSGGQNGSKSTNEMKKGKKMKSNEKG
jgi:hypothetical protein